MMSTLLTSIQELVGGGRIRVSAHGFEELASDDITLAELIDSLPEAVIVEEYQDYHKGPCVLVLQSTNDGRAVHVLWGIAKNTPGTASLITAYRPDPERWSKDFLRRKPR